MFLIQGYPSFFVGCLIITLGRTKAVFLPDFSVVYTFDGIIIDIKTHLAILGIITRKTENRGETMNETLLKKDDIRKKIRLNLNELQKR